MLSEINNPQSICILRLSAIGDVCHAVATVQAIQQRWPRAKICWVIGKVEHQLLKGLTGVEFVTFDKKSGLSGYFELRKKLKSTQFDILLHMQISIRASLATLCIKAKEVWGFDKVRAKELQWLFTNRQIPAQQEAHVADAFLEFAKAIGVNKNHQLEWNMPIDAVDVEWHQQLFNQYKQPNNYIVISPAARKDERNWLPERYAAFASYAHNLGFSVVLCGSASLKEKQLASLIKSKCDFEIINLVGKTSLKQLLVVIQSAKMLLAPDSGPAHLAKTVNTPVIGLYAHSNPKRTGPYDFVNYVVSCYEELLQQQTGGTSIQNPWGKRVKGQQLMAKISLEQVTNMFDRLIYDYKLLGE